MTQTGDVPANAKLLLIHAPALGDTVVQINDQMFGRSTHCICPSNLGVYYIGSRGAYYIDVSAWAGQTVTLSIIYADETGAVIDGLEFLESKPLRIDTTMTQLTPGGFVFSWVGEFASKYQVESTTNIVAGWQSAGAPVSSTNYVYYFTDTTVTNQPTSQRFYRLRTVP